MALATLSIDLVAQLASLQQGMDKAGRLAEKQAAEIEARYARLESSATAVGAALGGAISVAGLATFFRTTVNGLDALNDLKDATGASIENISALEDVAARTGTSFETVSTALIKFNKGLNDAKPGSAVADVLKAIGLSAEELKRVDPAEGLLQVATALAAFEDDGSKARAIMELFGKSTKEVAPLLKDLAEKGRLNATVTSEQAQAAEDFNKQMSAFAKHSTDSARALVSQLLPAINQLFDAISGKETGGQSPITGFITVPLQTAAVMAANVAFVLKGIGTEIGGIAAQATSLLRGDFKGAGAIGDMMKSDATAARKDLDAFEQRVMSIGKVMAPVPVPGLSRPTIGEIASTKEGKDPKEKKQAIDENTRALAQYVEQLQKQIDKTSDLTERQKALDMLKSLGVTGEVPQVRELVLGLSDELDLREKGLAFAKAMTAELARQKSEQSGLDAELAAFSGRAEAARKQALTARLEQRLAAGEVFSPEELDRMVKGIGGVKDAVAELDDYTKKFAENVQNTLGDSLFASFKGSATDLEKVWGDMLLRMAADAVAADITESLFGSKKAGGGRTPGLLSTGWAALSAWAGFADGGAFGPGGQLQAFAKGDVFNSPQVFKFARGASMATGVLGEAGPEAVMPLMRGTNGKLGVVAHGGNTEPAQPLQAIDASTHIGSVGAGVSRGEMAAALRQAQAATIETIRSRMIAGRFV